MYIALLQEARFATLEQRTKSNDFHTPQLPPRISTLLVKQCFQALWRRSLSSKIGFYAPDHPNFTGCTERFREPASVTYIRYAVSWLQNLNNTRLDLISRAPTGMMRKFDYYLLYFVTQHPFVINANWNVSKIALHWAHTPLTKRTGMCPMLRIALSPSGPNGMHLDFCRDGLANS